MRKASPPNIRCSVRPGSACTAARIRSASSTSYAILRVSRGRHIRAGDRALGCRTQPRSEGPHSSSGQRLLVDFRYGAGLAGLVSRCPAGRSLKRLPTGLVWLSSGLRPRWAPWRGVAQEGTALLEVALPVLADPLPELRG